MARRSSFVEASDDRRFNRTPGPPPFSSMKTTPAVLIDEARQAFIISSTS